MGAKFNAPDFYVYGKNKIQVHTYIYGEFYY